MKMNKKGFTLVELIVVMCLMGIIMAAVMAIVSPTTKFAAKITNTRDNEAVAITVGDYIADSIRYSKYVKVYSKDNNTYPSVDSSTYPNVIVIDNKSARDHSKKGATGVFKVGSNDGSAIGSDAKYIVTEEFYDENSFKVTLGEYGNDPNRNYMMIDVEGVAMSYNGTKYVNNDDYVYNYSRSIEFVNINNRNLLVDKNADFEVVEDTGDDYIFIFYSEKIGGLSGSGSGGGTPGGGTPGGGTPGGGTPGGGTPGGGTPGGGTPGGGTPGGGTPGGGTPGGGTPGGGSTEIVTPVTHTVTFVNADGSINDSVSVEEGTTLQGTQVPNAPVNDSYSSPEYTFLGWFKDGDASQNAFSTPISEDMTFVASWQQNKAVHFVYDDGTEFATEYIEQINNSVASPNVSLITAPEGMRFSHWYKQGDSPENIAVLSNITEMDTTFVAAFEEKPAVPDGATKVTIYLNDAPMYNNLMQISGPDGIEADFEVIDHDTQEVLVSRQKAWSTTVMQNQLHAGMAIDIYFYSKGLKFNCGYGNTVSIDNDGSESEYDFEFVDNNNKLTKR